jgi:hypothetical protein
MRRWWLVGLCACRIGFDATGRPADADLAGADASDANGMTDATATTITFGERPSSQRKNVTSDAYIDQQSPFFNFGAADDLSVAEFTANGEHTLLRFELSSIATGTTVAGARLTLTKLDYGDETPGSIQLRLLGESWVEGTNNGSTSTTGVTWTTRDGVAVWTTQGGTTTAMLTTVTPTASEVVVTLDAAVVQQWIDKPATNDGVLITVGINTAHFHLHSRNSTMIGSMGRPELALDLVQ